MKKTRLALTGTNGPEAHLCPAHAAFPCACRPSAANGDCPFSALWKNRSFPASGIFFNPKDLMQGLAQATRDDRQ